MSKFIKPALGVLLASVLASACTPAPVIEYRDVMVPQATLPELPPNLAQPITAPAPTFVAPENPQAVAALTQDQTLIFKRFIMALNAQLEGFKALFHGGLEPSTRPP